MAEPADLVLEQAAQRLDQLQRHVVGQTADVVVALDDGCRAVAAAALDHVGVQRALHEVLRVGESTGVLLEDPNEQLADRLALGLGLGDPGEAFEEPRAGVDVDQLDALVAAERLDDLIALAAAHQPGVDVHTRQLVADRLVDQGGRHRRVDPAAQPADRPGLADLGADRLDLRVDDRVHRPRRLAAGEIVQEALQE